MESPNFHFLEVYNHDTGKYWHPISFEEKNPTSPNISIALQIKGALEEIQDLSLPPLIIAISSQLTTVEPGDVERGDVFSRDWEIYKSLFSARITLIDGTIYPIRQFSDIVTRRLTYSKGPYPILMVGNKSFKEADQQEDVGENSLFRFWDSSIWHRYLHFGLHQIEDSLQRLRDLLLQFEQYHQKNLYRTAVAEEFLEFHCRKLTNSFIINLLPEGESEDQNHSQFVTPFHFHSEQELKVKSQELYKKIRGYSWGTLVIDDYFKAPLRTPGQPKSNKARNNPDVCSKIGIIDSLVNKEGEKILHFLNEEEKDPGRGYISTARNWIQQNPKADLILLDYFFGSTEPDKDERYGTKLLDELLNNSQGNSSLTSSKPFEKFWIFSVSVFEHAFESHLRGIGYNMVNSKVEWSSGADPVNTPELFRYILFGFLLAQKEAVGLAIGKFLENFLSELKNNKEILKELQGLMFEKYPEVIKLHTNFNSLAKLREEGGNSLTKIQSSVFATSYFDQLSCKNPDLLDHLHTLNDSLQQLCYNLAYGAGQEATKMLMDLRRIESILNVFFNLKEVNISDEVKEDIMYFINSIYSYIDKLT